jgi:uncharacterized membrane protein YdbT with pleckstrin-like domain
MSEVHTIKTNNSRKLYIPYYVTFVGILVVCVYLTIQGRLALPALGAAAVMVFVGVNATELHRIYQGYEVNPACVIHTKGYISKHSKRIDLFAINDVAITQTIFQRIFNMGDIHIHVANASYQTVLKDLHAPRVFAQTIQDNMRKARKETFSGGDPSDTQHLFKQPKKDDLFSPPADLESSDDLQEI